MVYRAFTRAFRIKGNTLGNKTAVTACFCYDAKGSKYIVNVDFYEAYFTGSIFMNLWALQCLAS